MRLNGLHRLMVDDLALVTSLNEEEMGPGFRKNEGSPIAKTYRTSGMSQDEIAKKANVHPSTISRYKSKQKGVERKPSFDTLKRLTSVVGARASSMFPELA